MHAVEPRYLELGYLELKPIFLGFSLAFSVIPILGYLELPAISNYFLFPLAQINSGYLELQ